MSDLEQKNFNWFKHDHSKASLVAIEIEVGELRGLKNVQINFEYPITAIAGKNGSGKTTLLAIAAFAYHNNDLGFTPFGRKEPYYTFSDFFVQSRAEIPPEGISLRCKYRSDQWRKTADETDTRRDGWRRQKKKGGKWSDYADRIKRNVVYMGIERVLPAVERSATKTYSKTFEATERVGWEDDVRQIVGRILSRTYDDFYYGYVDSRRYRLPIVKSKGQTYSGFNMGAGESALFEIFSTIFDCTQKTRENRGVLILVDEIELGLHEEAQRRLMDELKEICAAKQVQVICTTHSGRIFDALPPEGRIFIERQADYTKVMYGVSAAFATGRLSGNPNAELDIFVEDDVAKAILEVTLDNDLRARTNIMPIGSANVLMQQLAARYKEISHKASRNACVIMDGDETGKKSNRLQIFSDKLESITDTASAKKWASERIDYLPGTTWPEKWVLTQLDSVFLPLTESFGVTEYELKHIIEMALLAGKHNEFWELTKLLNLTPAENLSTIRTQFCRQTIKANPLEAERLNKFVRQFLP